MIYRNFKNLSLSNLGFGCMRFPTVDDGNSKIDEIKTAEMIDKAIKNGINYFDTAWGYHNGNSETVLGRILKKYPRESFFLASKFPGFGRENFEKKEEIFNKQLEKCQTEYFDFYLLHSVTEASIGKYCDEKYGLIPYLIEQKKNGKIKHLGFSTHARLDAMKDFLEKYGDIMEFCQIQLNWLDWDFQQAKEKVKLLDSYNIPVWVMEPLRGGKLVDLMPEYEKMLREKNPDMPNAEWGFRFVQAIPNVKMILSGMSAMDQLDQNLNIFSEDKKLKASETELLFNIAKKMTDATSLPCTACKYCVAECPNKINIPKIIQLNNELSYNPNDYMPKYILKNTEKEHSPSACIGCRACEKVCPQNIIISEMMKKLAAFLNS